MSATRRQFAWLVAATGASGLVGVRAARAADDDDLPPNLFISPPGRPYRAAQDAPYPVVDWFRAADTNADGKLDRSEFLADSEAFFHFLDFGKNGMLTPFDVQVYEHRLVPEILGAESSAAAPRIWLVQGAPSHPRGGAPAGQASPGGIQPNEPRQPQGLDESGQGASPYSFFEEPEPVTAADTSFRGYITKDDFLKLAARHFAELDVDNEGFLTLAKLPKTRVQQILERARRRRS